MTTGTPSTEVTLAGDAVTLGPEGHEPSRSPRSLKRGALVGRYLMLERIGVGGMGVVYAAYDPDLDRKIALKLLLPDRRGALVATERLLREAQATARLNHPHVITVHDVGTLDHGVFIAMEYLDGDTLGAWCKAQLRSVDEVLSRYVQAGRGLAAAHDAGLVHRDFKPDNVLLGRDGRVRVADFGLAREHAVEASDLGETLESSSDTHSVRLTQTGALLGTPAYMSPEQHLGEPADARSDQFSYCVSLYEALCDHRPWTSETIMSLASVVLEQPPAALPTTIPAHIRSAILRGLSREPDDRWPSMSELLAVLAANRGARRQRWWLAGTLAAAAVGAWAMWRTPEDPCGCGPSRVAAVWGLEQASQLSNAMQGTGVGYAEQITERTVTDLDGYAEAWVAAYTDACQATHVLREQSEQMLDLRMSCLDRRLVAMDAAVDVLAEADAKTTERAVELVGALPPLAPCSARDALLATVKPPDDPQTAALVEATRASLAHANALRTAGHYGEALDLSMRAVEELEATDYPPALAEALETTGLTHDERGDLDASIADLERGYHLALASGADMLAARVATKLVYLEGYRQQHHRRAELWADHAGALIQRLGSPPELEVSLARSRSAVSFSQGRTREAVELLERALTGGVEFYGEDHASVWGTRSNLAVFYGELGQFDRALTLQEQICAAYEQTKGPRHPALATALVNYAATLSRTGRSTEARESLERALRIRENALGPDHRDLASLLLNLGTALYDLGELDQAEQHFERSRDLAHQNHDFVAESAALASLANVTAERGEHQQATEMFEQALQLQERHMGDHPITATTLYNLAHLASQQEAWDDARRWSEQAVAIHDRLGDEGPALFQPLSLLGQSLRRVGQHEAAVAVLERAVALGEPPDSPGPFALVRLELARALATVGEDLPRARALATSVRDTYERDGQVELADEVGQWLAEHGA